MPTSLEQLWLTVSEKNYPEVEKVIKDNPNDDLINAVNTRNRSLFMHLASNPTELEKSRALIKYILGQPNFNVRYVNSTTKQNAVNIIIALAEVDLLEVLLKNSKILFDGDKRSSILLFDGDKLAYESVRIKIKNYNDRYSAYMKEDPNIATLPSLKRCINNFEKMIKVLREPTIYYAFETDNPSILQRLVDAGDNLDDRMSDGKLPIRLLTKSTPNLSIWFKERCIQHVTTNKVIKNTNFYALMELEQKKTNLELGREHNKIAISVNNAEKTVALTDKAINIFNKN